MARKISRKTPTWFMFEKLMMWRQPEEGPLVLPNLTRGKAINLCQGLNCCQTQYQVEQGRPDNLTYFSAKAKQVEGEVWCVEISENHTKQGTRSSPAWITDLLNSPEVVQHTTGRSEVTPEPASQEIELGAAYPIGDPRNGTPDEELYERLLK